MPRVSEEQFPAGEGFSRKLFEAANEVLFTCDAAGRVTSWNAALDRTVGPQREESFPLTDILAPEYHHTIQCRLNASAETKAEVELLTGRGSRAAVQLTLIPVQRHGRPAGMLFIGRDITVERVSERLATARRSMSDMLALDAPLDAMLSRLTEVVDSQVPDATSAVSCASGGRLQYIAGRLPQAFQQAFAGTRIAPMSASCGTAAYLQRTVVAGNLLSDPTWTRLSAVALANGLQACWSAPVLSGAGATLGTFAVYFNRPMEASAEMLELLKSAADSVAVMMQHHSHAAEISYQATHDPVTALPNRYALENRLRRLAAEEPGRRFALLHIGLDNLKLVSQTEGAGMGDDLVRQAAQRFSACVQADEMLARIGDGEFLLLHFDRPGGDVAAAAAEIQRALAAPVVVEAREIFVDASIGIAVCAEAEWEPETLVRNASTALALARSSGRGAVRMYAPAMLRQLTRRLQIRNELHQALYREEFRLCYQPQYNLRTGKLVGQEALLRWKPRGGSIAPADFIPVAEESGLIVPIGNWVLRQACRHAVSDARVGGRPVRVAVNVSAIQLAQPDFVENVLKTLEESGLSPQLLDIELTETALMRDVDAVAERILRLRVLGVTISVDDFGTGYSSLSRLQQIPLDSLKIDTSFVREIRNRHDVPPIIQAIVALGRSLGVNVIAEGVESQEQLCVLRQIGCDEGQGFLLGRPAASEDSAAAPQTLWLPDAGRIKPPDPGWLAQQEGSV